METLERAKLGIEAESFLRSALGKYMIDRADEIIESRIDALIQCSPNDIQQNTDLRNDITVCNMFKEFIAEAIQDGQIAASELDE